MKEPIESPDALCVCRHPKSEHKRANGYHFFYCQHGRNGTNDEGCDCNDYRPAAVLAYTVTSGIGAPPAHDVPAAQLRERLAEAERELYAVSEVLDTACVERTTTDGKETIPTHSRVQNLSVQLTAMGIAYLNLGDKLSEAERELASARAEADSLRAQLAALLLAVAVGGCLITTIVWRFLP